MSKQVVRPYELSLWTLQDSFITVLKSPSLSYKGQIQEPIVTLKTDGTQEINFSIPMYVFNGVELIENPIWYNVTNGALIANLRKVKVIFNKGEKGLEKIYEFVIEKVTESHQEGMLICEVSGSGLAFQELGKSGYKLYFGLDSFEEDYKNWFEQENPNPNEEPIANLDYWAEKLVEGTNWDYEVRMDWSAYDGILDNSLRTSKDRQVNKVYEDEYVASWEAVNGSLVPKTYETFREKARIVSVEKSNRYNISQTIAETFGVFCRYEYEYDDNYHITSRKIVFYNTFLDEKNGKIDIEYPYHTNSIKRELDSADVTTKLYVIPVSEESLPSGLITIADVNANKTYDDFILNFDYLYSIGTISQEQYDYVKEYESKIYIINQTLNPWLNRVNSINSQLPELQGELSVAQDAQKLANEEIKKAQDALRAIVGNDEVLERTAGNPDHVVLLKDNSLSTYYINVTQEGVLASTIKVYKTYKNGLAQELETSYTIKKDEFGNVSRLSGFNVTGEGELNFRYLTYQYNPKLQYNNIIEYYRQLIVKNKAKASDLEKQIDDLKKELDELQGKIDKKIEEKEKENPNFEKLMGPALREGSWQADEYKNYGDKGQESIDYIGSDDSNRKNKVIDSYWSDIPFEGEQLSYYESGINQEKKFYSVLNINSYISDLISHGLDNIFLVQKQHNSIYNKKLGINSDMVYAFFRPKAGGDVVAAIIITDKTFDINEGDCSLAQVNITEENGSFLETIVPIRNIVQQDFIDLNNYKQVYPRIKIESDLAQTDDQSLIIKNALGQTLKKYEDYSVLLNNLFPYINLKSQVVLSNGLNRGYTISYSLSNASLALYLDALEVSRDNAYPKASYEVELNVFDKDFLKDAYNLLGKIAHINDYELHFENVQGYISEIDLNLDSPWEDKFVTQNYKTKFEDLFSRIVASSEQMKTNALVYDRAANAFDSNGALKKENIQLSLNQSDLNYSFANGTLTINEQDGIWGVSDSGVVAFRGGGIFTANSRDAVGNWIWNSGITPNGINAALLTAGQLDTNLIKVYAGDNVRFQLNGDGLFAYRSNSDGTSNANNYVVHNSEGLFLTAPTVKNDGTTDTYDKVEISWDGLIVRNPDYITDENPEGKVFYADENGNLRLEGYVYARGGEIGGWGLDKTSLFSLGNTINENGEIIKTDVAGGVGMASAALLKDDLTIDENTVSNNNSYVVFWAGRDYTDIDSERGLYNDKFQVLSDGTLKASGVTIEGTINATGGKIGNLTIQEIEDGAKGTKSVQLIPITGTNFYISSTIIEPENLEFKIKYNGSLAGLTPASLKVEWDGGDGNYILLRTLNNTDTSFIISPSDIGSGAITAGNIKLTATFNGEENSYEAYSQIGFISNGKDGQDATADRTWLEFNYDNYYKWYNTDQKLVETYGAYIFSPSVMKVAIAYEGVSGKAYHSNEDYSLKVEAYKTEWTDITELATYNSDFTYSLSFSEINSSIWNFETIRVSIVREGKVIFSEVKVIAFGTSEQAAKFDFLASGAYITTAGINYQFDDQGFSITKYIVDESNNIESGSGNKIFYVDEDGNLQISGAIKAIAGSIGNWTINDNGIVSNYNDPYTTGVTATKQSIYYNSFNLSDGNMIAFLDVTDAKKDSSNNYSESEATRVSSGTQPVFYAGKVEEGRLGLYNNNNEWRIFDTNTTYTYSVLADGLVYAKNLALDGSLFVNNTISFVDINKKSIDRHIFSVNENSSLNIINPFYNNIQEQIFFGVEKTPENSSSPYAFAISHKGNVSIANGEIFIGDTGFFVTARNEEGDFYRLANGFSTYVEGQSDVPFLWAGSFVDTNTVTDINLENTAFYVDGSGITNARTLYTKEIGGEKFTTSSLILEKNEINTSENRLTIKGTNSYIDNDGNIVFNPFFTNELWVTEGHANKANGLLFNYNNESKEANISGFMGGTNNTTFRLSSSGTGSFNRIEADEFRTARFTAEEIGTINGSMLIANNLRYTSYVRNGDEVTFTAEKPIANVNVYDLVDIEFHNNPCRMIVTNKNNDTKELTCFLLSSPSEIIPTQGLLFIIGTLKLLVTITQDATETGVSFSIGTDETYNSLTESMLVNYITKYNQFMFDGYSAIGSLSKTSKGWIFSTTQSSLPSKDEILYLQSAQGSSSYSRIYLRALDDTPEIVLYRSLYLDDNPNTNHYAPTAHLNKASLVLKIGDLKDIIDPDFSTNSLSGSGLYGENVYLKGSLVLPSAGITNDSSTNFSYDAWVNANKDKAGLNKNDNSPVRFWAGAPGTNRQTAPLIITENGSLYATQGVFQGQIIATNGIFSGYITSTGVILDSGSSNFYFAKAREDGNPITVDDYLIDVTANNGLEIYDNGFCVFSGEPRPIENGDIYLDYSGNSLTGFRYQFPYVSALQGPSDKLNGSNFDKTLIAYNMNVLQFEAKVGSSDIIDNVSFSGMRQTNNSLEWYGAKQLMTLEGGSSSDVWKEKYETALNKANQQPYYSVQVKEGEFNLGPNIDDLQFSFQNNNLKFNTGNCVIESVDGGINIKVLS